MLAFHQPSKVIVTVDFYTFDDDYVRRLLAGDRWTGEHFLRYFQQLLLIKLRSRLRSMQAIDDVRQEVFLRVFRALPTLRDGRKLGAFVNSFCNNVLLEYLRSNGRTESLGDEHVDLPDPSHGAEDMLVTGETKAHVRRVLGKLDQKDGDLLRALFIEERDKDEICRDFHVDRNYLRVLVHRAKEKFRSEYFDVPIGRMKPPEPPEPPNGPPGGEPKNP